MQLKLKKGDEIRIISPSSSMERVGGFEENLIAKQRLENLGFKVTFGKYILENDEFYSSSIASRVSDFHDAFSDKNVKAIMTTIGGFNSNELLTHIDWDIVRSNPKMFFGYSDTTSLHNAIRAMTHQITYYGPCYSSFKMDELQEYQTAEWLKASLNDSFKLEPSDVWTSDLWFDTTLPRHPLVNKWKAYNSGEATGISTGGNIQTYCLQAGTPFFPETKDPIVFIEQAEGGEPLEFSRELAQILQVHTDIKALVIGRFPTVNAMNEEKLHLVLDKFSILKKIPVIYDLDFGHTQPIFTVPLGQSIKVNAINSSQIEVSVQEN
ncbi:S66 family peptidase [Leuconostoc pseudomesenteroides]|uniref:S66 family peptidase n=1 Tax=Leuconostoc pseudomesenteroides TaxID=33968 RepID=UPI0021A49ED3|nr:S66 peptidase family protein [Leuconostoc pseudomesenteroides]MCT4413348.1 LD-carboxypeptidase [Leuconostoc pseudomesenteroides]